MGAGIARPDGVHPYRNLLTEKAVENHFRHQARPIKVGEDVIPTPWPQWNWACMDGGGQLGLARGWHIILAGNTGAGKSIFSLNLAASAVRAGVTVGFANLEMSSEQLMARLLGILTGEQVAKMQRGKLYDPSVAVSVHERLQEIVGDARLLVNDDDLAPEPLHRLDDIVRLAEHWATDHGAGLIIVDYMQLAGTGRAEEVAERVTQVSRAVRSVARSKKVVTVGLSQFNRGTSGNYTESPRVQGLFGASGLENDGHQVALIDHSRYAKAEGGARTWILLSKNRHGPDIEIPVWFDHRTLTVREAMPDEEHEWPGVRK
jgi:replicative DNA helicase